MKKESKRYTVIFVDSPRLYSLLRALRVNIYYVDLEKDSKKIAGIVDSTSRA